MSISSVFTRGRCSLASAQMDHALEPDPARGVFSTMLVVDGRPVELDPHLVQLRESVRRALRDRAARAGGRARRGGGARHRAGTRAAGVSRRRARRRCDSRRGRSRSTARSSCRTTRSTCARRPSTAGTARTSGSTGGCSNGSRPRRRRPPHCSSSATGACSRRPRANVFALGEDGVLRTPPADGAILPGVTRAQAIAIAGELGVPVREEPLSLRRPARRARGLRDRLDPRRRARALARRRSDRRSRRPRERARRRAPPPLAPACRAAVSRYARSAREARSALQLVDADHAQREQAADVREPADDRDGDHPERGRQLHDAQHRDRDRERPEQSPRLHAQAQRHSAVPSISIIVSTSVATVAHAEPSAP